MKMYKEVLIESAEQAEELPSGTVAYRDGAALAGDREAASKVDKDMWARSDLWNKHSTGSVMVGWMALVPVEVTKEETLVLDRTSVPCPVDQYTFDASTEQFYDEWNQDITDMMRRWLSSQPTKSRYVTEWE